MKLGNPPRDRVVAADEPRRRAAVRADARRLRECLEHHHVRIDIGFLPLTQRRVQFGQREADARDEPLRLRPVGFARDHERRQAETQRVLPGGRGARGYVGDQTRDVVERLTVDEPHVAVSRDQRARRLRLAADIDPRTRAKRIGGTQLIAVDVEVLAVKMHALRRATAHRRP